MRPLLRPMVKYVGNMHGNELAGRQVLIALAEYLVHNYGVEDRVTRLLNTTEVMPLPSITCIINRCFKKPFSLAKYVNMYCTLDYNNCSTVSTV